MWAFLWLRYIYDIENPTVTDMTNLLIRQWIKRVNAAKMNEQLKPEYLKLHKIDKTVCPAATTEFNQPAEMQ